MKFLKKEKISFDGAKIIYESRDGREIIFLDDLVEVRYQWDLGVGLSHWLIFTSKDSKILIEPRITGVDEVLIELNKQLSNFPKVVNVESPIEEDLAWDNVHLWSRT